MQSALTRTLTIGSRGSHLALWQAHHVAAMLEKNGFSTFITVIKTTGDHLQTASLTETGGKGLFTKEIEDALLSGAIDLAVHSLKDLPTDAPTGLQIAAIPEREDPRDALVGRSIDELADGARVGTSSSRRGAQMRAMRPDLRIEPVRGNVDTRLRKLKEGQYDAILLAAAGLRRLGLESEIAQVLEPEQMCPAPGQGALAIQTRVGDDAGILNCLNHEATFQAVSCERAALAALGGGCQLPFGAFAQLLEGRLRLTAVAASPDGSRLLRGDGQDSPRNAFKLGTLVGRDLLVRGAAQILAPPD